MQSQQVATPFGRRPMSLGLMASQIAVTRTPKETTQKTTEPTPEGSGATEVCVVSVDKWKVFRFIREAREPLGATDRALAILNALLSFYPDNRLSSDGSLIVFPSNEQLIARANGMSPATLRRHLAVLVECGLIIRRDSPNGKRFARRNRAGEIEQAYGFDLSPIVARTEEFEDLAGAIMAEKKAYKVARERLTLLRRDIVKMIDLAIEENVPGNWDRITIHYRSVIEGLSRKPQRPKLEAICTELEGIWEEIHMALETFIYSQNLNASESHNERHIQNSNTESKFESRNGSGNKEEAVCNETEKETNDPPAKQPTNLHALPKRDMPLGLVLDACPDICELVQEPGDKSGHEEGLEQILKPGKGRGIVRGKGIRTWREFADAAELTRIYLGVSASAWREACEVMGEGQAAVTLAAILQRAGEISSHGGYLRSLTDKARNGKFSTWPMIMALLNAKMASNTVSDSQGYGAGGTDESEAGNLEVSSALAENLKKVRWPGIDRS